MSMDLSMGSYRPHLVVQDTTVRQAVSPADNEIEPYLGVVFIEGQVPIVGDPILATLALMYYPGVDYSALQVGATFTIREGPQIVGFGTVTEQGWVSLPIRNPPPVTGGG